MHYSKVDGRLKELYKCAAIEHGEGSSHSTVMKASARTQELFEELTLELEKIKTSDYEVVNVKM